MQDPQKDIRKKLLGRRGEDLTVKYLEQQGYRILERNYITPFGEADIIALKGDVYCFVEVKTRSSDRYGEPSEAVGCKKRERYRKIALFYCKSVRRELECRFDVASVLNGEIEYFEGAYI